ncbi:hypothetical protein GJ744_000299 [Endocarpon pusillum]|uniref:Uncharacterized protein n=1 Tax=Endocarpon pusillum TaxID=364733 RepID=A0A8H7AR63_9EURO|nr:hypothetical protein GJ744_000299 [Endocarpon pusillum]
MQRYPINQAMARTRREFSNSSGNTTRAARQSSIQARNAIASYYESHGRSISTRHRRAPRSSPPLNRDVCICNRTVLRYHPRTACWNCNHWHHQRWAVPYLTGIDHIDSCIYVWLWPWTAALNNSGDEPYRPCRLCRELTCYDPANAATQPCPWCRQPFMPTGAQAQQRWDAIFRAETFQAYAGRILMEEGKGDWNLRMRMAEFDPARFLRCDRSLLVGPAGPVPPGGHRLDAKEWEQWRRGPGRGNRRMRDIIIYEKRRGRQGAPPLYVVSRINTLAHTLEGDPDWDNFRDMFDDRSRVIV